MLNPMLANLNQNKIIQAITTIKNIKNPQMMLRQIPQYKEIMEYVEQNGGNAEKAFYARAKELGVDPNDILKAMRNA